MIIDVTDAVKALVDKARNAESGDQALKFSQAACNVANARAALLPEPALAKEKKAIPAEFIAGDLDALGGPSKTG